MTLATDCTSGPMPASIRPPDGPGDPADDQHVGVRLPLLVAALDLSDEPPVLPFASSPLLADQVVRGDRGRLSRTAEICATGCAPCLGDASMPG